MNRLIMRNPDNVAKCVHGGDIATAALLSTAAASATGTKVNQLAVVAGKKFEGVAMYTPITQDLATGFSIVVTSVIEHSSASGGTYVELSRGTLTITGTTASGDHTGLAKADASLVGAKKWIKPNLIFKGSASDTEKDRAATAISLVFFGPDHAPAATST